MRNISSGCGILSCTSVVSGYFGDEQRWSMAFYTYSNEKYEPCFFNNSTFHGTPEEAFDTAAVYSQD